MVWITLLLVLLSLAVLAYVNFNRNASARTAAKHRGTQPHSSPKAAHLEPSAKYWGKQLVVPYPERACASAKALQGQAYAIGHTPSLPLNDCNCVACECRFVALVDRRSDSERRAGSDRRNDIRFDAKPDRRAGVMRRKRDYTWSYVA